MKIIARLTIILFFSSTFIFAGYISIPSSGGVDIIPDEDGVYGKSYAPATYVKYLECSNGGTPNTGYDCGGTVCWKSYSSISSLCDKYGGYVSSVFVTSRVEVFKNKNKPGVQTIDGVRYVTNGSHTFVGTIKVDNVNHSISALEANPSVIDENGKEMGGINDLVKLADGVYFEPYTGLISSNASDYNIVNENGGVYTAIPLIPLADDTIYHDDGSYSEYWSDGNSHPDSNGEEYYNHYHSDGTLMSTEIVSRDADYNIIGSITSYSDGTTRVDNISNDGWNTTNINSDGNIDNYTEGSFDNSGTAISNTEYEYSYDSDGNYNITKTDISTDKIQDIEYYDNAGVLTDTREVSYNDDGSYIATGIPMVSLDGNTYQNSTTYDNDGNIVSNSTSSTPNGGGGPTTTTTTNVDGSVSVSTKDNSSGSGGIDITVDDVGDVVGTNCSDNGPALLLNSGDYTCDRTCSQVGYYTDLTGFCTAPNCDVTPPNGWVQTSDFLICDNFDTSQYSASQTFSGNSYCPDICFLKPIVIDNPDTNDDYYDVGDYAFNYNDYVDDVSDWSDELTNDWNTDYNIVSNINDTQILDENDIKDYVYDNGLPYVSLLNGGGDTNTSDSDTYIPNHSSIYVDDNSRLSDAPEKSSGSGGNSLSDDLKNLGNSVNSNTNATDINTNATDNLTEKLDDITSMFDNTADEDSSISGGMNFIDGLEDSANEFDVMFNDFKSISENGFDFSVAAPPTSLVNCSDDDGMGIKIITAVVSIISPLKTVLSFIITIGFAVFAIRIYLYSFRYIIRN